MTKIKLPMIILLSLILLPIVFAPQPFPDPAFNTTTGFVAYSNEVTDGWITILFMISGTIIVFSLMKSKGQYTSDSLLTSTFIMFVLGTFFWAANLIAGKIILLWLFFVIASAIYSYLED